MRSNKILLLLLILICIPAVYSFFHSGFFPSHDGEWMVVRFSDFHRSFVDGQWPVRIAGRLNFGYGYPVFNFLYPGTFYLAEIFHLLKLNFVDSVKALFVVSYILSGISMFILMKEWTGRIPALAAAVLYLYTPYRFVDMYVRGSLGEATAFMFIPLIFFAIVKIYKSQNIIFTCFGAIALLGLITTHNVIAYLFLPIIILYALYLSMFIKEKKQFLVKCMTLIVLGLGLSCFFWFPALAERQFTIFNQTVVADYTKNFPRFWELIIPNWGYGLSTPGEKGSMSFQIGVVNIVSIIAAVFLLKSKLLINSKQNIFFLPITLIGIFFLQSLSLPLWKYIPGLTTIQFPWRILSVTTFTTAILIGIYLDSLSNKIIIRTMSLVIIISSIFLNINYLKPSEFNNRGEGFYTTNDDTTTVKGEYMPIAAVNLPRQRALSKVILEKNKGNVTNLVVKSNKITFDYIGDKETITVNSVYYPGWEVLINQIKQNITVNKNGLMNINVAKGKSSIVFVFRETPFRKTADIITFLSFLATLLLFFSIKLNYNQIGKII